MDQLLPDGTTQLSLSEQQFTEVNGVLRDFYQKSKCTAAILSHASGLVISSSGKLAGEKLTLLSALAAGNYSTSTELAQLIGEPSGFRAVYQEGIELSLYLLGVADSGILTVVFRKEIAFGMIRILAEKTGAALTKVLAEVTPTAAAATPTATPLAADFRTELSERLDQILMSPKTAG